jgi:NADPH:quinone reductase-like Zn-dependent oxidoreductase
MILGCDAAGYTDDGQAVVVHPVIGNSTRGFGDVTMDPQRAFLSETVNGGLAEYLLAPEANLIPKPDYFSFEEAAALPIAWGTAYRMLFTRAQLQAGDRILVQGATGGVASAAIALAKKAGATVYATVRSESNIAFAHESGADEVFLTGGRLPQRVDVVLDSVGEATWSHSLKSLRPGGTVVTCGATSGSHADADISRIFYNQLSVVGSTGCTVSELEALMRLMESTGLRPWISKTITLENVREGFEELIAGRQRGKIAVSVTAA